MPLAYISLGSNLADPVRQVELGVLALRARAGVTVQSVSSLYASPAWGNTAQPDFINAVVGVSTDLAARGLLDTVLGIETSRGRMRGGERWGPRIIDLDILTYADAVIDEPGLQLPHPRLSERAFVLLPLCELAPTLRIGTAGSVAELCRRLGAQGCRKLGPVAG